MLTLNRSDIQLRARPGTRWEAITAAAALLQQNGAIRPGYVDSMIARERLSSTYQGNGVAVPHGLHGDRDLILRTGVAVVQIPDGVEWDPAPRVYLVVAFAACTDEHLKILANLTDVIDDSAAARRLSTTGDPGEIVAELGRI